MLNRVFRLSALMWAASGLTRPTAVSPNPPPVPTSTVQTWDLPYGTVVKDAEFFVLTGSPWATTVPTVTGEVVHRQRVTRDYTRGLANGEVERRNVGVADGRRRHGSILCGPDMQDFIEGLRYPAAIALTR
jgi:hypothetical protein